jgi:hypothetical protein
MWEKAERIERLRKDFAVLEVSLDLAARAPDRPEPLLGVERKLVGAVG